MADDSTNSKERTNLIYMRIHVYSNKIASGFFFPDVAATTSYDCNRKIYD